MWKEYNQAADIKKGEQRSGRVFEVTEGVQGDTITGLDDDQIKRS